MQHFHISDVLERMYQGQTPMKIFYSHSSCKDFCFGSRMRLRGTWLLSNVHIYYTRHLDSPLYCALAVQVANSNVNAKCNKKNCISIYPKITKLETFWSWKKSSTEPRVSHKRVLKRKNPIKVRNISWSDLMLLVPPLDKPGFRGISVSYWQNKEITECWSMGSPWLWL